MIAAAVVLTSAAFAAGIDDHYPARTVEIKKYALNFPQFPETVTEIRLDPVIKIGDDFMFVDYNIALPRLCRQPKTAIYNTSSVGSCVSGPGFETSITTSLSERGEVNLLEHFKLSDVMYFAVWASDTTAGVRKATYYAEFEYCNTVNVRKSSTDSGLIAVQLLVVHLDPTEYNGSPVATVFNPITEKDMWCAMPDARAQMKPFYTSKEQVPANRHKCLDKWLYGAPSDSMFEDPSRFPYKSLYGETCNFAYHYISCHNNTSVSYANYLLKHSSANHDSPVTACCACGADHTASEDRSFIYITASQKLTSYISLVWIHVDYDEASGSAKGTIIRSSYDLVLCPNEDNVYSNAFCPIVYSEPKSYDKRFFALFTPFPVRPCIATTIPLVKSGGFTASVFDVGVWSPVIERHLTDDCDDTFLQELKCKNTAVYTEMTFVRQKGITKKQCEEDLEIRSKIYEAIDASSGACSSDYTLWCASVHATVRIPGTPKEATDFARTLCNQSLHPDDPTIKFETIAVGTATHTCEDVLRSTDDDVYNFTVAEKEEEETSGSSRMAAVDITAIVMAVVVVIIFCTVFVICSNQ